MMPLLMAKPGEQHVIQAVRGKQEIVRQLGNMGFVEGTTIIVVSDIAGNLIVNVKDARMAIDKSMAAKIFI